MYRHLLIPTDGLPLSMEAVAHGVELARDLGAKVSFLTVTEPIHALSFGIAELEETPGAYRNQMEQRASRSLKDAAMVADAAGVSHEKIHVEDDEPYRAIIRVAAERKCDLIVMASHGRHGASASVLGSETMNVLSHSSIPVLVFRQPDAGAKLETSSGAATDATARSQSPQRNPSRGRA